METHLKIVVDKDSADYRRLGANSLWTYIEEHVIRCFGPLAVVIKGKLTYDTYLKQCYVKDFGKHGDEKTVLRRLEELIKKQDLNFYSDIKDWIDQKRYYFEKSVGYHEKFRITEWEDSSFPRMLCGRKGSGKTTLMLFGKSDIEDRSNFKCIYVCLANPAPHLDDVWSTIKTAIIHRLDDLTLELCTKAKISEMDMVIQRHKRQWKLIDAYPVPEEPRDIVYLKRKARDEQLKELSKSKYEVEFISYFQDTIQFLKESFNVKLIVMIDDVDRLRSDETAKDVCDRARGLAMELGIVPVAVSIREETMAKLSDVGSFAARIPVIPPSFSRVLRSRLEIFLNDFKFRDDAQSQKSGYNVDKAKTFVKHIIESILQKDVYANLIAYHYDLDILLDVVRCLIQSPFIEPEYVLGLYKTGEKIPWHIVLDSMQRFQYRNFYDENSFLLNVFDNNESPATMSNTLIRVRLLQVIRHAFKGLQKPMQTAEIYTGMQELGYVKRAVILALEAFARQRLIVTWRMRNAFREDVRDILPQSIIVYYLDSLIYNYRYLQNVLPVTHMNFYVPMDIVEIVKPIVGEKLKLTDKILMKFIDFVRECEESEMVLLKDKVLFKEITRGEVLSNVMKTRLEQEILYMKKLAS